ncbi:MAG: hypothetical protein GY796_11565 [Chloroflexi bacterium]|nr:hypothetical protein [Chloroflexota bacterium]
MFDNLNPQTRKQLGLLLSIPERAVRSLAAVGGGTSLLLTETLIPPTLQESTLYRVTIGDLQQFLIEQVAQMDKTVLANVKTRDLEANFMPRRAAGSVIDVAGLLWMRFSPLWVFAIGSDAANGSKIFLHRLVEQLKQNEVLGEDVEIHSLTELLDALHDASDSSAQTVNMPPLSQEDIRETAVELRQRYGRLFAQTTDLLPRFEQLWTQMEVVAEEENTSTSKVSGMMALDLAEWGQKGAGAITAVGQTSAELLDEHILTSYAQTLDGIVEEGLPQYFSRMLTPFAETAVNHFDANKQTWTERMVVRGS